MIELTSERRRELRAAAHALHPVVAIAQKGLTPAVLKEIDNSLKAHELIKVRVFADEREQREAMLAEICAALGCAAVQHIGKLLVLWREKPAEEESAPARRRSGKPQTKKQAAAAMEPRRRAAPRRGGAPAEPASVPKARRRSP